MSAYRSGSRNRVARVGAHGRCLKRKQMLKKDNGKWILPSSGTPLCWHRVCEIHSLFRIFVVPKSCFFCSEIGLPLSYSPRGQFFWIFGGNGVALHRCFSLSFLLCTRLFLASGFRSRELKRNGKRARATLLVVFFWSRSRTSGRVFQSSKTSVSGRQKSSEFDRF